MRQYKFRAWDKNNNRFISDGFSVDMIGLYLTDARDKIYRVGEDVELMQFTGKQDLSGVEIYENDLIKATRANSSLGGFNDIYKVVYNETQACFCLECVKSDNSYRVGQIALTSSNNRPYLIDSKISKVIGNIYENPELLP